MTSIHYCLEFLQPFFFYPPSTPPPKKKENHIDQNNETFSTKPRIAGSFERRHIGGVGDSLHQVWSRWSPNYGATSTPPHVIASYWRPPLFSGPSRWETQCAGNQPLLLLKYKSQLKHRSRSEVSSDTWRWLTELKRFDRDFVNQVTGVIRGYKFWQITYLE